MPSPTPNSIIASWVMLIARAKDDHGYDSRDKSPIEYRQKALM